MELDGLWDMLLLRCITTRNPRTISWLNNDKPSMTLNQALKPCGVAGFFIIGQNGNLWRPQERVNTP